MTTTMEETCQRTQQLLNKWQGGYARLWEFGCSLDMLTIRIVADDRPGNLHLVCTPLVHIAGAVHWEDCKLRLTCEETDAGETFFRVCDENTPFQVTCRGVLAEENVEPMYGWRPASLLEGKMESEIAPRES